VVGVNKSSGTVSFEDGTNVSGDVIIGADGVHSVCRRQLSPGHQPFGSGKSAFRFMIPRQDVLSDPQTRPYAETDGELVMIYHSDRRMVMYPTSDNSILNFVCIHPEVETASTATSNWNNNATKSMLLEAYKDFSGDFKAILSKSNEDSLKIWKLLDMVRPVICSHVALLTFASL
jgi:2-polyprenyl-6-methoxyphenol hydroxylase-like FAD-dependent oxidoreductase